MSESLSSLSDDALSALIGESPATICRLDFLTEDVWERIRTFSELHGSLPIKPTGAALLYREPGATCARYAPLGPMLVVGRTPKSERHPAGSDLALDAQTMSRTHFEIRYADGFYLLRDLDSQNGTYMNDDAERVRESVLKAGDTILAGEVIFVFTGV